MEEFLRGEAAVEGVACGGVYGSLVPEPDGDAELCQAAASLIERSAGFVAGLRKGGKGVPDLRVPGAEAVDVGWLRQRHERMVARNR